MRIQQLSSIVANQIAAGEVIERPASVVKELLENALDAGADTISVEIGAGGLNHIKVSDNGRGIVADDLPLAIAAHATSKIIQLSDLSDITSMGFRGEALASIASISRLSIRSRPEAQPHAMMIQVESSEIQLLPCARSRGTTIEVRDLFFNAPVRKNFLKTERSEYQAIEAVVKRFALSSPDMALTLKHNGIALLVLPSALCEHTRLQRIRKLLGKTFVEQSTYLDVERAGLRLQGFVCGPAYQRSQNDKQWLYINQRMVKDKLLNHAVKQAYDNLLYPGRHPACLLYLTILPHEVDVNVHPTKHEVRFQQPRLVHDFMTSQISQALALLNPTSSSVSDFSSVRTTTLSTVREPYVRSPLMCDDHETTASSLLVLNTQYGLFHKDNVPYLIDLARLQTHRYTSVLTDLPRPLASRPLLVPVSYMIDAERVGLMDQLRPALAQLGLVFEQFKLRTIPVIFPSLDIQQFLQSLLENLQTIVQEPSNLLKLLINSQSFDAYQLDEDEKTVLSDYVQRHLLISDALEKWCVCLDLETCRGLWHD